LRTGNGQIYFPVSLLSGLASSFQDSLFISTVSENNHSTALCANAFKQTISTNICRQVVMRSVLDFNKKAPNNADQWLSFFSACQHSLLCSALYQL